MDYQHIRYEQEGPVTVVTIDRPERMNAVAPRTADELRDAWTRFRDDDDTLVGVLTGAGREAFESGTVKASGPAEILKLIQNVIEKQEERTRTRKLRTR